MRTAALIADEVGLTVDVLDGFGEADFGAWEGLRPHEIATRFSEAWAVWSARPDLTAPPGGESGQQTWARARGALRQIWNKETTILVVGHRTLNRIILSRLLGLSLRHFRRLGQEEACLNLIDLDAPLRGTTLLRLNDTCHLA